MHRRVGAEDSEGCEPTRVAAVGVGGAEAMRIIWEVVMPGGHEPDVSMGLFTNRDAAYKTAKHVAEKIYTVSGDIEERSYANDEQRFGVLRPNGHFSIGTIVLPRELLGEEDLTP